MNTKIDIRQICGNCDDFDKEKSVCTIRYVISNGIKNHMPRKPNQRGCEVFMFNTKQTTHDRNR